MPSVAEVVVSAKPDGVSEVESEMDSLEKSTEETTENLDESAGMLDGIARKFKGGMLAIVGGLAIATAGVLSQVPVLGQAMDGLKAVFQALGFQVDKKLRPFINKLSQEFFELSDAIFAGDYSQAKKEIVDLLNVFGGVSVDQIKNLQDLSANIIGDFIKDLRRFMQARGEKGMQALTGQIIKLMKRGLRKFINATDWSVFIVDVIKFMGRFVEGAGQAVNKRIVSPLVDKMGEKFNDAVNGAKEWGKDIINEIINGIKAKAGELKSAIGGITIANDLTVADVAQGNFEVGGDISDSQVVRNNDFIGSAAGVPTLFIDGREINKGVGRFRKDVLNRRG